MNSRVGVLGCGWLGLPLAVSLLKDGFRVSGSTTSEEKINTLKRENIKPFLISLNEEKIEGSISTFLQQVDILIINVPPKLRSANSENYVKKIQLLHQEVKKAKIQKILFVSSTAVYGNVQGEVTEATLPQPETESGKQLLATEKIFQNDRELKTTIIRFGGLIGPNRHPVTVLSGRQGLTNGNAPINLIHLIDCIKVITEILKQSWWNEIINGVYPEHPSKQSYYRLKALEFGIQIPDYKEDRCVNHKIIRSKSLINVKKFSFTTTL